MRIIEPQIAGQEPDPIMVRTYQKQKHTWIVKSLAARLQNKLYVSAAEIDEQRKIR